MRLDIPAAWEQLPTDPEDVEPFLTAHLVAEKWVDVAPTDRRIVENAVRRLVNEMSALRCTIAAVFADAVESDSPAESDEPGLPSVLCATVLVAVLTRRDLGTPLQLTPEVLLAALGSAARGPVSYRDLQAPEPVALGVGAALHTRRLQRVDDLGPEPMEMLMEQYYVPVEPEFEQVVLIQFATPALHLGEEFSKLFAAIAGTFALYREGEPTPA